MWYGDDAEEQTTGDKNDVIGGRNKVIRPTSRASAFSQTSDKQTGKQTEIVKMTFQFANKFTLIPLDL